MSANALCTQWLELSIEEVALDTVKDVLSVIPDDPWVVAAAADKCVDDVDVQRAILDLGLDRSKSAMERSHKAMLSMSAPVDEEEQEGAPVKSEAELQHESLVSHFSTHSTDELLCRLRAVLLERLDKLDTYVEISQQRSEGAKGSSDEPEDGWDDPWNEEQDTSTSDEGSKPSTPLLLSLSSFLRTSHVHAALLFATNLQFGALGILFERHAKALNPHRLAILQNIPEHAQPSDYRSLLLEINFSTEMAVLPPEKPWRDSVDWTETEECRSAFHHQDSSADRSPPFSPPSASEVSKWYRDRIYQIDSLGLVDIAFATVQHGASQGVQDLDELGEELGLLARLVYDTPRPADDPGEDDWTLSRWKSLEPSAIVQAYLAHSTPNSIPDDIRRLVMPYLFVLESRAERAGHPDPNLVDRLFHEYLLHAPLALAAAIFEASKPTLPSSSRLIKKDEDMARLALACLYGSESLTNWPVMSRIFECLPEWSGIDEEEGDEADTTLISLGDFVTPSTSRPRCSPTELLVFFTPLPASALSRVLDVLDVHLESGEILARRDVPAPLKWFLQSANNAGQQRAWATRMARHASTGGDGPESEDEWLELLDDMLKLVGGGEGALRGAFGLLSKEEITRIFFGGLLSSGNFAVAKSVLRKSRTPYLSDPQVIEDQVLASSREFYDNASSGNLYQGDMKLAYECLNVAVPSATIQREREFIEATSRICSFNIVSRLGIPISPIEIRLVKDRLSLVARVLSSTEDAYKHSKVILDLVYKLGYRDDVAAEVKALAMLADAALQAEDFTRAAETCERMVEIVHKFKHTSSADGAEKRNEAIEVCWHSCFQLGRQTEFHDATKKLGLLGHALQLCPPEHMLDVLSIWRKVEGEDMPSRLEKLASQRRNAASRKRQIPSSTTASLRARLQDLQLPSSAGLTAPDAAAAAALASRTFKSVAANFPFSVRGRQSEEGRRSLDGASGEDEGPGPDVSAHAKKALSRGIGWLIGADEE